MVEHDFDSDSEDSYDPNAVEDILSIDEDEESGFENIPNPKQEEPKQEIKKEKKKESKKSSNKIEIDIDSVESLVSNLQFAAKELEASVDKVQDNRELVKILDILNKIELEKFENVKNLYSNIENKIDTSIINNIIESNINTNIKKIDTTIDKNIKEIQYKTKNIFEVYEKYGEAFDQPEVLDTLEKIETIEKFTKNLKFKSIIFAVIITILFTSIATFFAATKYLEFEKNSEVLQIKYNLYNSKKNLDSIFKHIDFTIEQDDRVQQIIFPQNTKINTFITSDNKHVIEFVK